MISHEYVGMLRFVDSGKPIESDDYVSAGDMVSFRPTRITCSYINPNVIGIVVDQTQTNTHDSISVLWPIDPWLTRNDELKYAQQKIKSALKLP